MITLNQIKSVLYGLSIGDALGVPVEFIVRSDLAKNPVKNFKGLGTHYQPAGTWSDDSSMAFCLAESLCNGYDITNIANKFVKWYYDGYWTARGDAFDIGRSTLSVLHKLVCGADPTKSSNTDIDSNGNGSLMRILPLVFYIYNKSYDERFKITKEVSSITHAHPISIWSCFYYLEFARLILEGNTLQQTYDLLLKDKNKYGTYFKPLFELNDKNIKSDGYVVNTLTASIYCLLTTTSYKEAVLKAVNLGEDSDTTGCVTGGLAGLYYGFDSIPKHWVQKVAKFKEISSLAERLFKTI